MCFLDPGLQETPSTVQSVQPIDWRGVSPICNLSVNIRTMSKKRCGRVSEMDFTITFLRIVYLQSKNVRWVIENPATSLLWRYRCIRDAWALVQACLNLQYFFLEHGSTWVDVWSHAFTQIFTYTYTYIYIYILSIYLRINIYMYIIYIKLYLYITECVPLFRSQDVISRFNAVTVTIPLGAYGAFTIKPASGTKLKRRNLYSHGWTRDLFNWIDLSPIVSTKRSPVQPWLMKNNWSVVWFQVGITKREILVCHLRLLLWEQFHGLVNFVHG